MSATKNRGLGRGLDAIFGTTTPAQQSKPMTEMAEVALSAIEPNPLQPRTMFDDEALQELSASIAQLGVIQPITLKPNGKSKRLKPTILALLFSTINTRYNKIISNIILL